MRRRRSRRRERRQDGRWHATNDLFALRLPTVFSVVTFERLSKDVCLLLCLVSSTTRITLKGVAASRSLALRVLTVSHIQAYRKASFNSVTRQSFLAAHVSRRVASVLRYNATFVQDLCHRIGYLTVIVRLTSDFTPRRSVSVLLGLQRHSTVLYRRLALQYGNGLQALSLLFRFRIRRAKSSLCDLLSLIASHGRRVRIHARRFSYSVHLHAKRRNISAVEGELSCFSIDSASNERFLASVVRGHVTTAIFRSGQDFSFQCICPWDVLIGLNASNLTNGDLSFKGLRRRFFYPSSRLVQFFRKGTQGEACVSHGQAFIG